MKREALASIAIILFASHSLLCSQATKPYPVKTATVELLGPAPERDTNDLFDRASKSRFVIVGKVSDRTPVAVPGNSGAMDTTEGGVLYKIQPLRQLCDQSELVPSLAPQAQRRNEFLYMFVPFDEPRIVDRHYAEKLAPGGTYPLFLVEAERAQQEKWIERFKLDKSRTYYRGEERARGVVPLVSPDANTGAKQPEVLGKMESLCSALNPPEVDKKISNLRGLETSGDPILAKEAAIAIDALTRRPE